VENIYLSSTFLSEVLKFPQQNGVLGSVGLHLGVYISLLQQNHNCEEQDGKIRGQEVGWISFLPTLNKIKWTQTDHWPDY
jgi:hypothetical protein